MSTKAMSMRMSFLIGEKIKKDIQLNANFEKRLQREKDETECLRDDEE